MVVTREVQSGAITGHSLSGTSGVCAGEPYIYTANIPGGHRPEYTYNWSVPSGITINSTWQNTITVTPTAAFGGGVLGYTVTTVCGTSAPASLTIYKITCGQSSMTVFPNPAVSDITIMPELLDNTLVVEGSWSRNMEKVLVLDKTGKIVKEIKFAKPSAKAKIDLSDLDRDYYFVMIYDGNVWKTTRILKEQ